MLKELYRWFFFRQVELKRHKWFKAKRLSEEADFRKRVSYLAKSLQLQFGGKVSVSHSPQKAYVIRDGLVLVEVTVFDKSRSRYIVVRTNIEPLPRWWVGLAFVGTKWNITRFPAMPQLTYEKPREQ